MIDPRFIVRLTDEDFVRYEGVLDAATNAGLHSLVATVVQIPATENGCLAVVIARAQFDDGRMFESVGSAGAADCAPESAAAALATAELRAGGRAMGLAVNCGLRLFEGLPEQQRAESLRQTPRRGGRGRGSDWSEAEDQELRSMYGQRKVVEIAAELGRPLASIHGRIHRLGLARGSTRSESVRAAFEQRRAAFGSPNGTQEVRP